MFHEDKRKQISIVLVPIKFRQSTMQVHEGFVWFSENGEIKRKVPLLSFFDAHASFLLQLRSILDFYLQ